MSCLVVFGVLTGVEVDVSKFFGVGAGVLNRGAGVDSESEKGDSAHLWHKVKLRHRLDFSWIPRLTQHKLCLISKFQFDNLNKVLHSKNQLHDM